MGYYNPSEAELWVMITSLVPALKRVNSMWVVGAHRFDEDAFLFNLFPDVDNLVLFEPIPEIAAKLKGRFSDLYWIKVIDKALYGTNGTKLFGITNNDAASSSLLALGTHKELFPDIEETHSIFVEVRTIPTILKEENLEVPKILVLDTQGAEGAILQACPKEILSQIHLIYTEASLVSVYKEQWILPAVTNLLNETHRLVAYSPITPKVIEHGNAVFLNRRFA